MDVNQENCIKKQEDNRGFSLIEVSIAMIVIGVLLAAALQIYNLYSINKTTLAIRSNLDTVSAALERYVTRYGRYPTPAPRDSALGSATFGREVTTAVATTCSSAAGAAGAVCWTNTGSADTAADGDATPDRVLIGDVPFATIGIKYNNTIDPWGGKLVYAVTENLTSTASYNNSWGAINVLAEDNSSIYGAGISRAHYFIFSSGPDKRGAFGQNGAVINACGTALNGTDFENCNLDGLFKSNQDMTSTEKRVMFFDPPGASHFDDYSKYSNSTNHDIWARTAAAITGQVDIINTNTQNVRIGPWPAAATATCKTECQAACGADATCLTRCNNCTPLPRSTVDVNGTVKANRVNTDRWCYGDSSTGTGCVPDTTVPLPVLLSPRTYGGIPSTPGVTSSITSASNFAGTRYRNSGGGILCASNMAMNGIYQGNELCASSTKFDPAAAAATFGSACSAGHYVIGRKADGTWCCDDDASCNVGW